MSKNNIKEFRVSKKSNTVIFEVDFDSLKDWQECMRKAANFVSAFGDTFRSY